jgi:hypothetical protein
LELPTGQSPIATLSPDGTIAPHSTVWPGSTQPPAVTLSHPATRSLFATASQVGTRSLFETVTPVGTRSVVATVTPVATLTPIATRSPVPTLTPFATQSPVATPTRLATRFPSASRSYSIALASESSDFRPVHSSEINVSMSDEQSRAPGTHVNPAGQQEDDSNGELPLLIVSILLMVILSVLFAFVMLKESERNKRSLDSKKKERLSPKVSVTQ